MNMNENAKLIRRIQTVDFCVTEAAMFLDTHPNDKKALAYYKKYRDMLAELKELYEEKCGPLTIYGVQCDRWNWVECQWPWEMEAN